jgi:hypothetical protein
MPTIEQKLQRRDKATIANEALIYGDPFRTEAERKAALIAISKTFMRNTGYRIDEDGAKVLADLAAGNLSKGSVALLGIDAGLEEAAMLYPKAAAEIASMPRPVVERIEKLIV